MATPLLGENDKMVESLSDDSKFKRSKCKKVLDWLTECKKFLFAFGAPLVLMWIPIAFPIPEAKCGFVLLIMIFYWLTDCVPIAITGLLPLALLPLFGIVESHDIAHNYMKDVGMLFICTSVVALLIEKTGLHKRIGIKILLLIGHQPGRLLFGLMIVVYFCSMWINNLAATTMMLPIVEAIIEQLRNHVDAGSVKQTKKMLGLSVAYSASIGGTATLAGTMTNPVLLQELADAFGSTGGLSFGTWMAFALPVSLITLLLGWIWIQLAFQNWSSIKARCCGIIHKGRRRASASSSESGSASSTSNANTSSSFGPILKREYEKLGSIRCEEILTCVFFVALITIWASRDPAPNVTGWRALLGLPLGMISDVPAAALLCILCFMTPVRRKSTSSNGNAAAGGSKLESLLNWPDFQKACPWGLLLTIGGGFAISEGCKVSGLGDLVTKKLQFLTSLQPELALLVLLVLASALTEIASNVVVCSLVLPLFADLSVQMGTNPLFLLLPVTIACSHAFLLPIGTPPNALVHMKGFVDTRDMLKCGAGMNVIALVATFLFSISLGNAIFEWDSMPSWVVDDSENLTTTLSTLNVTATAA